MSRQLASALLLIAMIVVIVAVDVAFLRHNAALRLVVNVGIASAFVATYFVLIRRP